MGNFKNNGSVRIAGKSANMESLRKIVWGLLIGHASLSLNIWLFFSRLLPTLFRQNVKGKFLFPLFPCALLLLPGY
jgi:hypothetical protein